MAVEEKLRSKRLYKLELLFIKAIPMCMAFFCWLNTFLSIFDIDCEALTHIGGCSIITLLFLYLTSYVFLFCEYHRMFLHYITVLWSLLIYDLYIGIPIDTIPLLIIYLLISGIALSLILYVYVKTHKRPPTKDSR